MGRVISLGGVLVVMMVLAGCNLLNLGGGTVELDGTPGPDVESGGAGGGQSKSGESTEGSGEVMSDEGDALGQSGDAVAKVITLAEVAKHGSADDCWIAIEGKVYDVTSYIDGGKHPGGTALLQGCGTDGTELYNDRPNGSGAHSAQARSFLPNFYIGDLASE